MVSIQWALELKRGVKVLQVMGSRGVGALPAVSDRGSTIYQKDAIGGKEESMLALQPCRTRRASVRFYGKFSLPEDLRRGEAFRGAMGRQAARCKVLVSKMCIQ